MNWKSPHPMHVVQVIPCDLNGKMLVMHRSANLRSARDVWSFPSGMHDVGETMYRCAAREMLEEYDLQLLEGVEIGTYENIAGDADAEEQWHWVITVIVGRVPDVSKYTNKEPEKHDQTLITPFSELADIDFWNRVVFHKSFTNWAKPRRRQIYQEVARLCTTQSGFMCSPAGSPSGSKKS